MRPARYIHVGVIHHVICRFVDREWFIRDARERARYLEFLGRALARSDWRCLAYALMSNHLHFAMLPGNQPLGHWTKAVNSPFARWMNKRHGRKGPLFAERPASYAMKPHDEAPLIAYIHNNPVRAGVVGRAAHSDWTSHRAFIGATTPPTWLHVELGLGICGIGDRDAFDGWVNGSTNVLIQHPDVAPYRIAARARGALDVGTPRGDEIPLVRRRQSLIRPDPVEIVELVAEVAGVDIGLLLSRTTRRGAASARRVALHVAARFGITASSMSALIGISSQSGSRLSREPLDERELATRDRVEELGMCGRFTSTMTRVMDRRSST